MCIRDSSASALLSRLQELAVLGANDTNTDADNNAINAEAEAIADEFHRLMSTSTYKGKDVFADTASSDYVSMGGRAQEMTFGLGRVKYSNLYVHSYVKYAEELLATPGADNANKEINAMADLAKKATNGYMSDQSDPKVDTGQAIIIEGVNYEVTTAFSIDADVAGFGDVGLRHQNLHCLLYTSPSPRDQRGSRMPSSA